MVTPTGGVMASRVPEGIISPGAVGYDINCGVRVLASSIEYQSARPYLNDLANTLYRNCPSGMGKGGSLSLSAEEFELVCLQGAGWALAQGYGNEEDLARTRRIWLFRRCTSRASESQEPNKEAKIS